MGIEVSVNGTGLFAQLPRHRRTSRVPTRPRPTRRIRWVCSTSSRRRDHGHQQGRRAAGEAQGLADAARSDPNTGSSPTTPEAKIAASAAAGVGLRDPSRHRRPVRHRDRAGHCRRRNDPPLTQSDIDWALQYIFNRMPTRKEPSANAQKVMTLADTAQLIAKVHKNAAAGVRFSSAPPGRIRQHRRLLHRPHGRQDAGVKFNARTATRQRA